jgi:predicted Ser/Thr protein kinase
VAGDRDDELARTATAPASSSSPVVPAAPIDSTLGRYRIERELGAGGMGVVHAAFDPDLERRVALKVLRAGGGGDDARQRLLREARAMARLTHPNVVTVHEVGSAGGRDYVAMELVDGETLADWLRAERRPDREILAAFVAAGRGLAAAHAAGIVHRDFKPHNVLRHRNGRIVVTDFGLAREAHAPHDAPSDPLAVTVPLTKAASDGSTSAPSVLGGLTATGSVLGTPAYMAPEQWTGGAVTPATDQFAFCVALWEALAGERPFKGASVELLREAIARGPAALDTSKIPRRLRRALRRGLDPIPARRWPSMEALLVAMIRAERRPVVALTIGACAVVAAAIGYVAVGRSAIPMAAAAVCPPAALDPAVVWPDGAVATFEAAGRGLEARMLDGDLRTWKAARAQACAAPGSAARLACLDGVLVRFDVVARAIERAPRATPPIDAGGYLIEPRVCDVAHPPTLVSEATPELRDVLATAIYDAATPGPLDAKTAAELAKRVADVPCASAWARMLVAETARSPAERDPQLAEAVQDAERCDDDRVRAEVATGSARHALAGVFLGTVVSGKVNLAATAVKRVAQPDLEAEIDLLRLEIAQRADNVDEAIARGEAAMAGFAARGRIAAQLTAGLSVLDLRQARGRPDDLKTIDQKHVEWRKLAVAQLGEADPIVRKLDAEAAAQLFAADVAAAHARLEQLRVPVPFDRPIRIAGRVIDPRGGAVAGATVVAGRALAGDSVGVVIALPSSAGGIRTTTTNANGEFEITDAPDRGAVIAELADRRARAVPIGTIDGRPVPLILTLEPTSRIEGRVDLHGVASTKVTIALKDLRTPMTVPYELIAPVRPDGSFVIDGAPRTRVRVFASLRDVSTSSFASTTVDVRSPVVRGVSVTVTSSKRIVHVVVRSTVGMPVSNAQVFVLPGQVASTNARMLNEVLQTATFRLARQIEREHAPPPVITAAHAGDMFATMSEVPEGVASACAVGLPADLSDSELQLKINAQYEKIQVRCVPIPAGADVVVVEVPPWPRLD